MVNKPRKPEGTASYSNIDIIQKFLSKILRLLTNTPWFMRNNAIHRDLNIYFIREEIKIYSTKYQQRLSNHQNSLLDDTF